MSSDEDYLFDEDDVDSGNESPENSDDDEEDWGMDIGLGRYLNILGRLRFLLKHNETASECYISKKSASNSTWV